MSALLQRLARVARATETALPEGTVQKVVGLTVESAGPAGSVGELCRVETGGPPVPCEIVGFREERALLMPLASMEGLAPGARVEATGRRLEVPVSEALPGRVLDGLGNPLDGAPRPPAEDAYPVTSQAPPPLARQPIDRPLGVGVRSIDGPLTCGRGQRVGIFSGSGVGKSTLLGMIARNTAADVAVAALVGERGREVREFVERDLGDEGRKRTVVVAATSDQAPLLRIRAAHTATAIAEFFRDRGADVVLLMDSVTRFAMAQRELGLAAGEPPTTRGYTPSVFSELPRLLERSGRTERGSITGFYTVLVEGDDLMEPVTDAVRAILDGHVVLSRALAERHHYPPVDVLRSVSRLMPQLVDAEHLGAAARLRQLLAAHRDGEDLVQVGAYRAGTDPLLDEALARWDDINAYLRQDANERSDVATARAGLQRALSAGGEGA